MIHTYDDKKIAAYDIEKLGNDMKGNIEFHKQCKQEAIIKAEAYYNGYHDAIRDIASIMSAGNYRVKEVEIDETEHGRNTGN